MKVLAFTDIHLDAVTAGRARRAEVLVFLERVQQIFESYRPEVVVFCGDAHDAGSLLDPLYSADLIRTLLGFRLAITVAIPGNHDVLDTSEMFEDQPVSTLTPVRAASAFCSDSVHVIERPKLTLLFGKWAVIALPYVAKAHKDRNQQWLDETFEDATQLASKGWSFIVVSHLVVPDARLGSESLEMAKGQDQMFPFERVAALGRSVKLVLNGHYHAQQHVQTQDVELVLPGAPVRFTFGELAHVSKGVYVAELK